MLEFQRNYCYNIATLRRTKRRRTSPPAAVVSEGGCGCECPSVKTLLLHANLSLLYLTSPVLKGGPLKFPPSVPSLPKVSSLFSSSVLFFEWAVISGAASESPFWVGFFWVPRPFSRQEALAQHNRRKTVSSVAPCCSILMRVWEIMGCC